jgi:hypothetical protein
MFELSRRILFSAFLPLSILSGCVTTQERADGSKVVRISVAEALGLRKTEQGATPQANPGNSVPPASTPLADSPQAPLLLTTPLAGLFAKHPYDGTTHTYFPRVALTIVDWSRSDCWMARAKIWWSASKSENVDRFSVCFGNQSLNFAVNNAVGLHLFAQQLAIEHTGNVRADGPKPPMIAFPDNHPFNVDRIQKTFNPFVQQLIVETGWKGGAPTNFWIVGYNTQPLTITPPVTMRNPVETKSDNKDAMKDLERALECVPMRNLAASLKAMKLPSNGEIFDAPRGLKAFGLPAAKVSFNVNAGQGDSLSTAVFAPSVTFDQLKKAASLKFDKTLGTGETKYFVRHSKVGQLNASPDKANIVKLACSPDSEGGN